MFITRQNLNGARKLTGIRLSSYQGKLGYKLGYCSHCNEPLLVSISLLDEFFSYLHLNTNKVITLVLALLSKKYVE